MCSCATGETRIRRAGDYNLSQPPQSKQIRRLESFLGTPLFERSRRHVVLTEAGQLLVPRARRLLAEAERTQLELVRVAPRRAAQRQRRIVDVRALRDEPCVLVRREVEPAWAEPCAHALRLLGVGNEVAQETDSQLAMLGLVAACAGVCVVSESMAKIGRSGVVFRPLRGFSLRFQLYALSRPRPSPRVKFFLSII